jgi:hypothetical protein
MECNPLAFITEQAGGKQTVLIESWRLSLQCMKECRSFADYNMVEKTEEFIQNKIKQILKRFLIQKLSKYKNTPKADAIWVFYIFYYSCFAFRKERV